MKTIILLSTVFFILIPCTCKSMKKCSKEHQCYAGFRWNETFKSCTACENGYFGLQCAAKCFYPHYGRKCRFICNCSAKECHYASGCKRSSKDITPNVKSTTNIGDMSVYKFYSQESVLQTSTLSKTAKNGLEGKSELQNSAMLGIIILAIISVVIILLIACTYISEKCQRRTGGQQGNNRPRL